MPIALRWIGLFFFALLLSGCHSMEGLSSSGHSMPGGEFGATPGGVQSLTTAREFVNHGHVPPAEAFVVEGMFSEHDLPLSGEPCDDVLCVRGALGVAPDAAEEDSIWVQVGLSSTIDPENFEREPIAIVAVVDVSGSMGWGYQNDNSPGEISRELLLQLSNQLDSEDRIAIVTFGSDVNTVLEPTPGGAPTIAAAINGLSPDGVTKLEDGLRQGYALAEQAVDVYDEVRVILFSDMQPNVGLTEPSDFEQIAADGADEGVSLTVLGLGLGLQQGFLNKMSHLRGGNAFSLMTRAAVDEFVADHWPWFVSPIAYELQFSAESCSDLEVKAAYGFPGTEHGEDPSLEVATVFLSKNRGALLLELKALDGASLSDAHVDLNLSYTKPDGSQVSKTIDLRYNDESVDACGVYMPQDGIDKTVALALLTEALHESASLYQSSQGAAASHLAAALERFDAAKDRLNDSGINDEAEFWPKLLKLIDEGAPQGDFYGQSFSSPASNQPTNPWL